MPIPFYQRATICNAIEARIKRESDAKTFRHIRAELIDAMQDAETADEAMQRVSAAAVRRLSVQAGFPPGCYIPGTIVRSTLARRQRIIEALREVDATEIVGA